MARKTISEFKAKSLLFEYLSLPYQGIEIKNNDLSPIQALEPSITYVVKVDQGIKKRFKLGLITLDVSKDNLVQDVELLMKKGFSRFIIEPFKKYAATEEKYLSLQRVRNGMQVAISTRGGVDVEEQRDSLIEFIIPGNNLDEIASALGVSLEFIKKTVEFMDDYYISFLEINPFVIKGDEIFILDLAVEVDSAGEFFVKSSWNSDDIVSSEKNKTKEEVSIDKLSSESQASFKLDVLNKDGSIFMLLSGGGASIVLADEVFNQGKGRELANYGEYSGNPNTEETYYYTQQLLRLLVQSAAKKKALIIAGGVANFTDIRVTFKGIIQAITEVSELLREQGVKVFVRRGGPYEKEGLSMMENFLKTQHLLGTVSGPELVLTDIVAHALREVES